MPLSYFALDANSGAPQPAHANVPTRFSELSGDENGRSVASLRSTSNAYGSSFSFSFHSPSLSFTLPSRRITAIAASLPNSPASAGCVATNAVVAEARLMRRRRDNETASSCSSRGASADARARTAAPRRAPGPVRRVVRAGATMRTEPRAADIVQGVWVARRRVRDRYRHTTRHTGDCQTPAVGASNIEQLSHDVIFQDCSALLERPNFPSRAQHTCCARCPP